MRFLSPIILVLFLSISSLAQDYSRWWQFENRLRDLSPEQFETTKNLAQEGDVDAEMLLAAGYRSGIVLPKDKQQYISWTTRAAEHGNPEAQFALSFWYARGQEGFSQDDKVAKQWLRRAAEQEHVVAQLNLGAAYMSGHGVERDVQQGESWITKSAEGGFTHAQYMLGLGYLRGEGLPLNAEKGEMWLRKAADLGHSAAMTELAKLYSTSEGVPRDPEFVETILLRSAEMGREQAQYQLGRMYRNGWLGTPDFAKALEWLQLSAAKDYGPAAFQLGQMYEANEGVAVNFQAAAEWYLKAAQLGWSPAIFKIGEMYRLGRGVPLDTASAYRWFIVGERLGASDSAGARKKLETELKSDEREKIQADAEHWIATHPREVSQAPGQFRPRYGVWVTDDPPPPVRGPATAEERAKAIQLAQFLETTPLGEEAKKAATWLADWMRDVPDIFFQTCDFFQEENPKEYRYRNVLFWQLKFSGAAYLVQHPDMVKDQLAIYHAGVLGALRAYEAILQVHPELRWPLLDSLLQTRANGGLPEFVHAKTNQICR